MDRRKKLDSLSKTYDPAPIEDAWYARWEKEGLFVGDPEYKGEGKNFSIVIPPPNVTGSLHMGHALNNTLQDIICRYRRMQGDNVLWLPGTDHAGIATQNVVEKQLAKEGLSRHDLGRDAFEARVWEWKEQYGSRIINQLKKLGASCDWDRERFTMDEGLSRAVREVFVELHKKGLIYRGKYIINWCSRCQTALSDLEVEHKELPGNLYHVAYPFEDGEGSLMVATTRPETILGDVAIAVHPRDEKNAPYVGRTVRVPLTDRVIPVIEDNMVDPEFGTGCVKITPAHDPNDFLVGQRHDLPQIAVIDDKQIMNDLAGVYQGLHITEARKKVVEDLKTQGLLVKVEEHLHSVGHCYRCDTVVEPYLSEQWFVKAKPLADAGVEAVQQERISWVPKQWENTYYQWMENIRDWCISRQLWWGHRIPAWECEKCGHFTVASEAPSACEACGHAVLHQDEDVLDTWFSSALWPFSTLGWPDKTKELEAFYPTSLLMTGFDIIFFWVSRMIMMGLEFMDGEVPFHDVYIHALVRDEHGQKMSKSRGNVIDPLGVIETYGADALRMTLAALTVQGRDIFLSTNRIETYRHFMNKLWNASRFALIHLEELPSESERPREDLLRLHDRWILERTSRVARETSRLLEGYFFGEAARGLYDFVWSELCDWYLEMAKSALYGNEGEERKAASRWVLATVFRQTLQLLHPFIPFATDELWQAFGFAGEAGKLLERSGWPSFEKEDGELELFEDMEQFQEMIRALRNLRVEAGLAPQQSAPSIVIATEDLSIRRSVEENQDLISLLGRVEEIRLVEPGERPKQSLAAVLPRRTLFLGVGDILDIPSEMERLRKEKEKIEGDIAKGEKKLENESFLAKAPEDVVVKERERLQEARERLSRVIQNLESLAS